MKVTDNNDAEVVSLTAEQAATSLFVSTPKITEGQTYKVASGSATAEVVAGENAQGGFGPGPGGVGGPGSGGSNDLGVVPPENGDLRAPALTGSSRRGETNQTDGWLILIIVGSNRPPRPLVYAPRGRGFLL